ncbi:MAG TPA: M15 family metallopeptidase [Rhizomicrobium sp.]|jgi:D-alanyl-D-alanine dipeptidase|nr:M15 family metallopeptidase [Rhizomicrobium sp.]
MTLFGALSDLRSRPIGEQASLRAAKAGFRTVPIARSNTYYLEEMVDVRDLGIAGENYYHSVRNPPYWRRIAGAVPDLLVRASVGEKLVRINARLGEAGLELFLFDAWRPRAVQTYFHDVWMPAEILRRQPALRGAALREEIERYWAAPSIDGASPAPHATGAAVDLTIRWAGSDPLWMGSIFDDATALAHRDRFESLSDDVLSFSDEEARANRRLLHWIMAAEGFAGHPDEWWHFSWGDQLWAKLTGEPNAHYSLAPEPI